MRIVDKEVSLPLLLGLEQQISDTHLNTSKQRGIITSIVVEKHGLAVGRRETMLIERSLSRMPDHRDVACV